MIRTSNITKHTYLWHYLSKIHIDQTVHKLSGEQLLLIYDYMNLGPWNNGIALHNYHIDMFFIWTDPWRVAEPKLEGFLKGIDIHTELFRNKVAKWIDEGEHPQSFTALLHILYFVIPYVSRHYRNNVIESGKLNQTWDITKIDLY